jgi:hypothetical protein
VWQSRRWWIWAAFLVALYLLSSYLSRHRVLINTEVWALFHAERPLAEQLEAVRQDLVHPPLMYLFERVWLPWFGKTDAAAKLLPVVINLPALILFTWLAWRVTPRWRVAAFLFSGSYLAAGNTLTLVRMYGLVILWMLIAILIWESWRQRPTVWRLAAWTAVMVLLVYTHYSGLLILAAFFAVNWMFGPRRLLFAAVSVIPALYFVPWVLFVLPVYHSRGLETNLWWVRMLLAEPYKGLVSMVYEYLGPMPVSGAWRYVVAACAALIHLLLLVFAIRSFRRMWPPRRDSDPARRWFWVVALLAGVPVALLLLFSVMYTPALASRFLIGILPAYWLLLVMLGEMGGRRGLWLLYGVMLPWVLISSTAALIGNLEPHPVRARIETVAREMEPGDIIVCLDELANPVFWELTHRLEREAPIRALAPQVDSDELSVYQRQGIEQGERLSVIPYRAMDEIDIEGGRRVWLFHNAATPPETIAGHLAAHGFVQERTDGGESPRLSLYRRAG